MARHDTLDADRGRSAEEATSAGTAATSVRLLLVDDDPDDAKLITRAILEDGLDARVTRVSSLATARHAVETGSWAAVVCDFNLGAASGLDLLETVRSTDPDLPFILVSGAISEEVAAAAMRAGAQDYVLKDNLARLAPAVRRELLEAAQRRARSLAEERYRALVECSLQGLLMVQDDRVVIANRAAADILGMAPHDMLGLGVGELLDRLDLDPADHDSMLRRSGASLDDSCRLEVRLNRTGERGRWIEVWVHKSQVGGKAAIQVALADITRRRDRERELEAIATLATALRSSNTQAEMTDLLLAQTRELLHAGGTVLACPGAPQEGVVLDVRGGIWAGVPSGDATIRRLSHEVFTTGRPLVLDLDAAPGPGSHRDVDGPSRVVAGVPLIAEEAVIGALWIGREQPVDDGDLRVLRAIGDMAASALRRVRLHEETSLRLRRLHALRAIDLAITNRRDLGLVFDVILEQATSQLAVDAASILRVEDGRALRVAAAHGRPEPVESAATPFGSAGLAGRVATDRRMMECRDLTSTSLDSERDRELAAAGFAGFAGVPLLSGGELCGVLELLHREPLQLDEEGRGFLESIAWQAAIAVDTAVMVDELRQTNLELLQAYESTLEGWARALELRDQETEGHTRRVTEMTVQLAREFGIEGDELVHIRRGALLHDVGKLGVPDSVLLKPGPLDEREWEIMRRHPVLAVEMLGPLPHLEPALTIPYCHHERWDGSGYPRGLEGEEIPLAARLFAVVDLWDALASDRPYRTAWNHDEIIAYLQRQAGTHLDAHAVDVFLERVLPSHLHSRDTAAARAARHPQARRAHNRTEHRGSA